LFDDLKNLDNITQNANSYVNELSNNYHEELDQYAIYRNERKKGTRRERNRPREYYERDDLHMTMEKEEYTHTRHKTVYRKHNKREDLHNKVKTIEKEEYTYIKSKRAYRQELIATN